MIYSDRKILRVGCTLYFFFCRSRVIDILARNGKFLRRDVEHGKTGNVCGCSNARDGRLDGCGVDFH